MFDIDAGLTALGFDQTERIELAGDAIQITHTQEAFGQIRSGALRRLGIAVEDLAGDTGELFAGGIVQIIGQAFHRRYLAAKAKGAEHETALDMALQVGIESVGAV